MTPTENADPGPAGIAPPDLPHPRRCVELAAWLAELAVPPSAVRALPVSEVAPGPPVHGPVPGLDEQVRQLHRRFHGRSR